MNDFYDVKSLRFWLLKTATVWELRMKEIFTNLDFEFIIKGRSGLTVAENKPHWEELVL